MTLMPPEKINLLRDLRGRTASGWLSNDGYMDFLETYPSLEKAVYANEDILKKTLGVSAQEFLKSLSKDRPPTNFNPDNVQNKPRPKWSRSQISRLRRVQGL